MPDCGYTLKTFASLQNTKKEWIDTPFKRSTERISSL